MLIIYMVSIFIFPEYVFDPVMFHTSESHWMLYPCLFLR